MESSPRELHEHFEVSKELLKSPPNHHQHQCTSGLDIFVSNYNSADDSVDQAAPRVKRQRTDSPPPENTTIYRDTVPNDTLENILSRLPARKVGEFRTVCKGWKELTSTKRFMDMHIKHWYNEYPCEVLTSSKSSFYLVNSPSASKSYSLTDERILRGCNAQDILAFSTLGFLVFNEDWNCVSILNPVTREKVKLIISYKDARLNLDGQVYAIFLHPKIQETCVLWGQKHRSCPKTTEFQLLNLKSTMKTGNSRWRSILPRLHRYTPRRQANGKVSPPVIHNNALYWMIEFCKVNNVHPNNNAPGEFCCEEVILAFDVQTEEFQKLPHPGRHCADIDEALVKHGRMQLLSTKSENISVIEFCKTAPYVYIWEWERRSVKWIMKHKIRAFGAFDNYSVFGMVDEERVLLRGCNYYKSVTAITSRFYLLNLKKATVEALEGKNGGYFRNDFVCAHMPTFTTMTSNGGEVEVRVPSDIQDIMIDSSKNVIY